MKPICQNCKNWTETRPEIKVGICKILNIQTEAEAGITLRTPKKLIICESFKPKDL